MSRLGDTLMGMDRTSGRPIPLGGLPGGLGVAVRRRPGIVVSAFLLFAILTIMVLVVIVHVRGSTQAPAAPPASASVLRADSLQRATSASAAPRAIERAIEGLGRQGLAAANRGAFDEAARLFERAIDANPRDAETWNNLGVARTRQGDVTGGIDAFRKAVDLDKSRAEAQRNLAVALERQGKDREAAQHYRAFLSLVGEDHPDRAAIRQRLATTRVETR